MSDEDEQAYLYPGRHDTGHPAGATQRAADYIKRYGGGGAELNGSRPAATWFDEGTGLHGALSSDVLDEDHREATAEIKHALAAVFELPAFIVGCTCWRCHLDPSRLLHHAWHWAFAR